MKVLNNFKKLSTLFSFEFILSYDSLRFLVKRNPLKQNNRTKRLLLFMLVKKYELTMINAKRFIEARIKLEALKETNVVRKKFLLGSK
tara:strand:+ start:65486 stop:65749 length:264 start_codon:yes stop_codon:yes gene_type:complete